MVRNLTILLTVLMLSACKKSTSEQQASQQTINLSAHRENLIARKWKLQKFSTRENKVDDPGFMVTAYLNFKSDHQYDLVLGQPDQGTWSISQDGKVLITYSNNSNQQLAIDILSLDSERLILFNDQAGIRMELTPFEAEAPDLEP